MTQKRLRSASKQPKIDPIWRNKGTAWAQLIKMNKDFYKPWQKYLYLFAHKKYDYKVYNIKSQSSPN
jgi:hypothetical protein